MTQQEELLALKCLVKKQQEQIEGQLFLFEEAQKLSEELGVEQKKSRSSPIPGHHGHPESGPCQKRLRNTRFLKGKSVVNAVEN